MGCDIHMTVERKVEGRWVCVNTMGRIHVAPHRGAGYDWASPAALDRNYARFALLAGVRGDGPPPRGLSDDISETTRVLVADEGSDRHSHGWLPLSEAARIFADTEYGNDEDLDWLRKYPSEFYFAVDAEDDSEHRLVFWFDN